MRAGFLWGLVGAFALLSHLAFAQTSEKPAELSVAPSAAKRTPEATSATQANSPANICRELLAYLQQASKAASPNPKPTAAPATDAPAPGQTAPAVDRTQHTSGQSAPIPSNQPSRAPTQITLEQAQSLEQANDLRGCQNATQTMRRAGIALPDGLIALAALREDLLINGSNRK